MVLDITEESACIRARYVYLHFACLFGIHMLDTAEKRLGLRLWRAGLKGPYLKVRCFPLGKGLSYVSSHAHVMERVTVDKVMQ